MNSCVLMATIVADAQLRSTQDGASVSSMLVEFPSTRQEEPPGTLKVEGWGNLAEEMKNSYTVGDCIIIEGRLSMNLIDRDGYKEKRAALVASRIYPVGGSIGSTSTTPITSAQNDGYPTAAATNVVDFAPAPAQSVSTTSAAVSSPASEPTPSAGDSNEDWDEIPF